MNYWCDSHDSWHWRYLCCLFFSLATKTRRSSYCDLGSERFLNFSSLLVYLFKVPQRNKGPVGLPVDSSEIQQTTWTPQKWVQQNSLTKIWGQQRFVPKSRGNIKFSQTMNFWQKLHAEPETSTPQARNCVVLVCWVGGLYGCGTWKLLISCNLISHQLIRTEGRDWFLERNRRVI